ncbi:Dynein heavy chain at 62B [Aphelenchoides fujianensis]|nr:Dynein heavy chain at 62B [Aphelenchoides fujianensis]
MYAHYRHELKTTPVDLQVSRLFNDRSAQLDVYLIQRCLDYTPFEQTVVHQTCGQLVKLEKWADVEGTTIVVEDFMNVLGMQVQEGDRCSTPCEDRLQKAEKRVLLEDDEEEQNEGCWPAVFPESELNDFPSWDGQIKGKGFFSDGFNNRRLGIELTAPELMLVENDESAMALMKELERLWLLWNSEIKTNFRSERTRKLVDGRHLYFDKKPAWLVDESYAASTQNISNTLLVHRMISNHFWSEVAPRLTYAWCDMMQEQEQMLIEDLAHRMENFLRGALKVSKFDWTLEVCEILLVNKECWIDVLLDDVEKEKFFNSIASLQAFLLRDVVYANVESLMNELTNCKLNNPFYIKVELANADVARHTAWDIVKRLVEIGTDVVRVECRLYPTMYPEQKTFSIASSVILEKFEVKSVEPYKFVTEELAAIRAALEVEENENRMYQQLLSLEARTKLIRTIWFAEPYEFDFSNVKKQLLALMQESMRTLQADITSYLYGRIKLQKLYGKDQLSQMYNLVIIRDEDFPKLKQMINQLHANFWKLAEVFDFTGMWKKTTMQKYYQASRAIFRLGYLADLVWQKLLVDRTRIERILNDRSTAMHYEGALIEESLKTNIKKYRNCHTFTDLKMIANRFQELSTRTAKLSHDHPILDAQLKLFNLDTVNVNSESLAKRVNILADVSTVHKMIVSFEETFMNSRVIDVDCGEANAEVANLNQKFKEINTALGEQEDVDESLKDALDLLFSKITKILDASNKVLPVVNALCSQGMKLRHWDRILPGMNLSENAKEELIVKDLLKVELEDKAEKCEEVSTLANKEMVLEEALDAMKKQWAEVTIQHIRNATTGIHEMEIKNEVVAFIEEQIIKTQMNISSPFATTMLPALKDWLQRLQRLQSTVDTYRKCIGKWTYLEPLFGAEDIAYQMPEEWRIFQEVSTKWRALNEKLSTVSKFLDLSEVNYTKDFTEIFEIFQRIQRGFDSYLQKRKLNYPRLYFLSNNELLEMLSRARNPEHIQPYLFKMFSSVANMECKNRSEITAVFSERGEKFKLSKAININHFKRHVDKWLAELEREIKQTVKTKLKNMMRMCGTELPSIYDLIGEHGAQTVLLHCRLVFTQKIEDAIVNGKLHEINDDFEAYMTKLQKHDADTDEERLIIENLLIEISDQRQIIGRLIAINCKSIHSYEWTSQLRYYWSNDNLFIRVYNLNILYGYEYYSIQPPFVMTPIIRKVHRELMTFQSQGYAGMLKGPAATGKSESVKELAKILGNFFVVFNCSPQVDRHQLEDLICGTVLSGTTLCLDEFNRLSEADMAWFASHMLGIYQAQLSGTSKTTTMIVNVFEQCQALLSLMHHYDFHLRTALATVNEAVALKSGNADESEVVGRAIRHVLTPYIVNSDINTFDRIVVSAVPQSKKHELDEVTKKIIIQTIEEMNLVANEKFVETCFNIFHLSRQRQAFILLGKTLSGKSTAMKVVKRVLKLCSSITCRVFKFNPSQMDSDFLYGHYDGTRLDWVPGLLAQKLAVKLEDNEEGWLILDGVLDSIWVESMNSLFDSNKKLCLSNGETVPLNPNIRIVFECDSLERVAPSTVSRCQVVYFDDEMNPVTTWNRFLPDSFKTLVFEMLESPTVGKLPQKKTFLERISCFVALYKNYEKDDKDLCPFVLFNVSSTVCNAERHKEWMSRHGIHAEEVYTKFPTIIGQWTKFEQFEGEELRSHYTKALIKQLVQFSEFMVMIYGRHGRGRIEFLEEIVQTFEPDRWEVHVLDLSAEMDTCDLLSTILGCNLVRMHSNHYTGQGEKSVLIVLRGMERLKHTSSNSTYEFFRSFYDFGRVLTPSGESIRFSGVHFLTAFTSDEVAPDYIFHAFIHQFDSSPAIVEPKDDHSHRSSLTIKEPEKPKEEFEDSIVAELQAACHDMQPEVYPLCSKYVKCAKSFGSNAEIEAGHELLPAYVVHLEGEEKAATYESHVLEKKLREIISNKQNVEPERVNLHEYLVRKFAFLHKVITMPLDGHCIMIGEPENRAVEVCEMVAHAADCFYETPMTQITDVYWRETIIKLIRMCLTEKRKIVFFVSDDVQAESGFGLILSDFNRYDHSDFISFVQTYCHMVTRKKNQIETMEGRYKTGIQKLNRADEQMNFLQEELVRLQPELVRTSLETTVLMSTIERETIEIENAREVVAANEFKANETATKAQALKIRPVSHRFNSLMYFKLNAAVEALEILNQRDISTLKTMRNPPQAVRLCMEAVCVLLGEQPTRTKQAARTGKPKYDYWPTALKLLSDIHFLSRIRSFQRDKVPPNVMKLIPDTSLAATGLCLWVRAIDTYERISKIVEPKKQKLKKSEQMVKHNMKQLELRRKALQDVTERLQALSDKFSQMSQKKQDLQNQNPSLRNEASGVGGRTTSCSCKKESETYRRTVLVGAAIIAYLGNVEYGFRKLAVSRILHNCAMDEHFSMRSILDHTSILCSEKKEKTVETYVIIDYAQKIPFIIDPHGESHRMLPRLLGERMVVLDLIQRDIIDQVVEAVREGKKLILDNISEPLPLFVLQLLKPKLIVDRESGQKHIQLEQHVCRYHEDFRLYFRSDRMERGFTVDFFKNLEEKILDVLGKSKDLDNDRVVDMLGGVRELSSAYDSRTFELNAVEEQLARHRVRYTELAKYTARLIHMSMSLSKLSPFYLRNLRFYFDIFKDAVGEDQKLFKENKMDALKQKVLHAFRSKIMNSLFSEHRAIFDFVTQNGIGYNDINKMSDKDFLQKFAKHIEPTDLNLRDVVFSADSRVPITLLLNSQSTYVIRNLYTFSEQLPRDPPVNALDPMHNQNRIHLIPTDNIANFDWKYCLEDDQWFIIQNCQLLTSDQLAQLGGIANSDLRKENFRMFIIIYPESGEARHSLLGRCNVVTVDDDYTLKGFLIYCYSTISPMFLHEKLDTAGRKELLYRLCCFHYCLVERSNYGFYGWTSSFRVSTVSLESAVNLFKDLCDRWSEINFSLLYSNVLEVAYLSDVGEDHDLKVFHVLAQWIFVGLNKYDNHIIETMYLKNYNVTIESMIEQIKNANLPKDMIVSGLNEKVARSFKCKKMLEVKKTIKTLLATSTEIDVLQLDEEEVMVEGQLDISEDVRALEASRLFPKRHYLKSLLNSGAPIRRIEMRQLDRPQSILEQLKQAYSKKHRIAAEELGCYGTLKLPNASAEAIEFSGCSICCGSYNSDYNCLQEAERSYESVETLWVVVRRRQAATRADSISVPFFYESASHQYVHLLDVELDTNLPESHWVLRGVKFACFQTLP